MSKIYYAALDELVRELVPHYAAQRDLLQAFWELFGEVAADPFSYKIPGRLRNRLDKFTQEWKKPLKLFEVAYKVSNLKLGTDSFSFGRVCFLTMDDAKLNQWGIPKDDPRRSHIYGEFSGQPVAIIQVDAVDNSRAFETGLRDVLFGLDLLRIAGVIGLITRLDDEMFLWKIEGHSIARQINPPHPHPSWGWHRTFRPIIADMAEYIRKGLEPQNSSLMAIANGELPKEITSHLKRTIRWVSSSVMRERLDDKVVDLCTALETMLLPGYQGGWKGQMIDLRHRLIGGDWSPGGILKLYELRSKIVHGSALDVSSGSDYWYLLLMCFEALKLLINHSKRNPQVQTLEGLIRTIETQEKLENFIELFQIGAFKGKGATKVLNAAIKQLRELQKRN